MRHALFNTLAAVAVAASTACSDTQPTEVETDALIASAPAWKPSDITRGLAVDDATRQKIEAGVQAMHTSLLELHARFLKAETLEGDARAAYMKDLHADVRALHEQHVTLWKSLDPAVRESLGARLHERMQQHEDDAGARSLHERLRRMHGGDHGAADAGH